MWGDIHFNQRKNRGCISEKRGEYNKLSHLSHLRICIDTYEAPAMYKNHVNFMDT